MLVGWQHFLSNIIIVGVCRSSVIIRCYAPKLLLVSFPLTCLLGLGPALGPKARLCTTNRRPQSPRHPDNSHPDIFTRLKTNRKLLSSRGLGPECTDAFSSNCGRAACSLGPCPLGDASSPGPAERRDEQHGVFRKQQQNKAVHRPEPISMPMPINTLHTIINADAPLSSSSASVMVCRLPFGGGD